MQKGTLIGQGNTAEVFAWGDQEVLKLFRKEFPRQGVEEEYTISREIQKQGLPAPKVTVMTETEGRFGIVYERIHGVSMLAYISKRPWCATKTATQLADLHHQIHQHTSGNVPKQKESLAWRINQTDQLSDTSKQKVLRILDALPDGDVLCHGDFHPGNVIVSSNKAVILDWMTATRGNPLADVARTKLLLRDAALPTGTPLLVRWILTFIRNRLYAVYLRRYRTHAPVDMAELRQWEIPIAAARLTEWVPPCEKDALLALIHRRI